MDKRIINNAISAYFGMGLLLLLPTKNEYIKNPFVKSHAKTAVIIHLLFLVNYLIFITKGFLGKIIIPFIHYNLNNLIICIIFLFLFLVLLFGVYKASRGESFGLKDFNNATKADNIIEMKKSNLNEEGKVTIILSYVPFIGYYIYGKFFNYKSPIIINNVKLNILITLFLILVYILGYSNVVSLLALFYIVLIIFFSVLIIANENIINFNLASVPTFIELKLYISSILTYLKNYFSAKKFIGFKEILIEKYKDYKSKNLEDLENLRKLRDMKLSKYLIYLPYLNLITLLDIKSKYKNHIINGFMITLISILFIFLGNRYQILLLIPIFAGMGFINKLEYKTPFIYDIYEIFLKIKNIIFRSGKKVKEQRNKVEEISFKLNND